MGFGLRAPTLSRGLLPICSLCLASKRRAEHSLAAVLREAKLIAALNLFTCPFQMRILLGTVDVESPKRLHSFW